MSSQENTIYLSRRDDIHLARKIWHISAGLAAIIAYFSVTSLTQKEFAFVAAAIALFSLSLDVLRINIESFNQVYLKLFSAIIRTSERNSISGVPYFAAGSAVSLYFFQEDIMVLSILFLVFADPIASIVGIKMGTDKILPGKSLQGTIAAFLTCYMITIIYILSFNEASLEILAFSMIGGFLGAGSELLSDWIDDNFAIPVLSGLGLTMANWVFSIF